MSKHKHVYERGRKVDHVKTTTEHFESKCTLTGGITSVSEGVTRVSGNRYEEYIMETHVNRKTSLFAKLGPYIRVETVFPSYKQIN